MSIDERKLVLASSTGTIFEAYDFFLAGALAPQVAKHFFSSLPPAAAFIFSLLGFAAGFVFRPIGAIVFGTLGDRLGRKRTFLATISLMGIATFVIGVLPGYQSIGIMAPAIFIFMRLLQGFSQGGEYGAAAIYVAEHAPASARGAWTSWIQAVVGLGFLLSMAAVVGSRLAVGDAAFEAWGWRIPFWISLGLLAISFWIRAKLEESPIFAAMKQHGSVSKAPIREAFSNWRTIRLALAVMFGPAAGFAAVWYTAQFYTVFFLNHTLHLDNSTTIWLVAAATIPAAPLYVYFGRLSDRIGRKPIILTGYLLAAVCFFPIFKYLAVTVNPELVAATQNAPVTLMAYRSQCSLQFNPVGVAKFDGACDVARSTLSNAGISYQQQDVQQVGSTLVIGHDTIALPSRHFDKPEKAAFEKNLQDVLKRNGYPLNATPSGNQIFIALALLFLMMIFGTMVYGPLGAWLVELFPARIRFSAMSLPFHVGAGWIGGFLPAATFSIVASSGNIFYGLVYPIGFAALALIVAGLFLPETAGKSISD